MISLATPLALILLPLPLVAARLLPPMSGGGGALFVPLTVASRFGTGGGSGLGVAGRKFLPVILWLALVVALAGPRIVVSNPALPASGRDIVLALDLSGSMKGEDFELNGEPTQRLEAVKRVAINFVRRRVGDRVGLVIFAERAYFAASLTYDVEAVARRIDEATIGISGRSTAISEGLGLALKRLETSDAPSRVVILLSDGVNTSGKVEPRDAAKLAQELGVRVHTIALGLHDTTDGSNTRDAVDAETLRAVAELSGGTSFRVRTTADLEAVGHSIDEMESNRSEAPAVEIYRDLWIYPAILAFLIALGLLVIDRRRA
jgi:Ca-activated chloride channel family protein